VNPRFAAGQRVLLLEVVCLEVGKLHKVPEEAGLEGPVAVNGNGEAHDAAWPAIDVVAAVDTGLLRDFTELLGSFRNYLRRLAEALRTRVIPPEAWDPMAARSIQIRVDSS